jgi:hypothetical protein
MTIDWNDKNLYSQVVEQVEEIGMQRMKAQPHMDEADFGAAAGAMATTPAPRLRLGAGAGVTALGKRPIQYPAGRTLGLMFGKSPLARRMESERHARDAATRDDGQAAQDAQPESGSEVGINSSRVT